MKELIGLEFKRNVYGPSLWTDTITEVSFSLIIKGPLKEYKGFKHIKIMVKGKLHWFPLEEIVIVADLNPFDKYQLEKAFFVDKAKEEWINRQKYKTTQ